MLCSGVHETVCFRGRTREGEGGGGEGRRLLGSIFAEYVLLGYQNPYPIIRSIFLVYFADNYRPHLSHFPLITRKSATLLIEYA